MFRKMPFLLAAIIIAVICFNNFIQLTVKAILYAISLSIKSIILFFLPIIFAYAILKNFGITVVIQFLHFILYLLNFQLQQFPQEGFL